MSAAGPYTRRSGRAESRHCCRQSAGGGRPRGWGCAAPLPPRERASGGPAGRGAEQVLPSLRLSAGQLLARCCLHRGRLLLPPLLSEELERGGGPVRFLGGETCRCVRFYLAPEKLCWRLLLSEVVPCPNTWCPFVLFQAQCLFDLLRALNLTDICFFLV